MQIHEDKQDEHIEVDGLQRPACHTFSHTGYSKYEELDKAECLRASGGDAGGAARTLLSFVG